MKKKPNINSVAFITKAARKSGHMEYVAAMRDGRRLRPQTEPNRKALANKRACRKAC